ARGRARARDRCRPPSDRRRGRRAHTPLLAVPQPRDVPPLGQPQGPLTRKTGVRHQFPEKWCQARVFGKLVPDTIFPSRSPYRARTGQRITSSAHDIAADTVGKPIVLVRSSSAWWIASRVAPRSCARRLWLWTAPSERVAAAAAS